MTQFQMMSLFSHLFYGVTSILFLILDCLAAFVVANSKWSLHLNWLIPRIVDNVLVVFYQTIINIGYFFGLHWTYTAYSWIDALLYIANVVGIYSMIVLLKTLKDLVKPDAEQSMLVMPATEEPKVWPPAPKPPPST